MILYSSDENRCDAELASHPGHIGMKPLKILRAYLYRIRSKYQMPEILVKAVSHSSIIHDSFLTSVPQRIQTLHAL